jgi:uncharacterized protein (UPF0332 family)
MSQPIRLSKSSWQTVRLLIRLQYGGKETDRGTVSRLYYVCFHAAQAVLYNRRFAPPSHGAVSRLFGREVVLTGDATEADGSFLSEMYTKRQQADYRQSPPTGNIDALYTRTETFVADMAALIEDELDDDFGEP